METKTYFAASVQAAMEVARRELGSDAMLVTSRPASDEARAFGRLEVIFAWDGKAPASRERSAGTAEAGYFGIGQEPRRGVNRTADPLRPGLDEIRSEISALREALDRSGIVAPGTGTGGAGKVTGGVDEDAVRTLCADGFGDDTAREIVAAAGKGGLVREGIPRELAARIPVAAFTPMQTDEHRALAFIGPPGRGKTTSLVKVAVRYGLAKRIPTRIFAAGAQGVGAVEQLARYAAILGVPFQAVESFESLHLALQGERWKGLVLIDTPGSAVNDVGEMDAMARLFARRPEIEKHLVLRAEARTTDMQYMVSRFAALRPSRLLFTGLDEVRGLGMAANAMIRSGIGASFFGTGPGIPEDLEEVDIKKLIRSLWAGNSLAARAA